MLALRDDALPSSFRSSKQSICNVHSASRVQGYELTTNVRNISASKTFLFLLLYFSISLFASYINNIFSTEQISLTTHLFYVLIIFI